MKAETAKRLGGCFVVVPSISDFSIETIQCQTKLMGEYARICGDFKMADGTYITEPEKVGIKLSSLIVLIGNIFVYRPKWQCYYGF
jgi:hypothetical protein